MQGQRGEEPIGKQRACQTNRQAAKNHGMRQRILVGFWLLALHLSAQAAPPSVPVPAPAQRYLEILTKRPQPGTMFEQLYAAWLEQGSSEGLGEFLAAKTKLSTASAADHLLLATFHAHRGNDREALAAYETALKLEPGNAPAWIEGSRLEARALEFSAALQSLTEAAKANPDAGQALEIGKLRGRALLRLGKNEEALRTWKELAEFLAAIAGSGKNRLSLSQRWQLLTRIPQQANWPLLVHRGIFTAEELLQNAAAAAQSPSPFTAAELERFACFARQQGDLTATSLLLAEAIRRWPAESKSRTTSDTDRSQVERAAILIRLKDFEEARLCLDAVNAANLTIPTIIAQRDASLQMLPKKQ